MTDPAAAAIAARAEELITARQAVSDAKSAIESAEYHRAAEFDMVASDYRIRDVTAKSISPIWRFISGYRVRDVTEMRKGRRRITTCKLYARTGTSVDSAYVHVWTGSVSGWSLTAAQILEKAVSEYLEGY